jgi:hypothetical protein
VRSVERIDVLAFHELGAGRYPAACEVFTAADLAVY